MVVGTCIHTNMYTCIFDIDSFSPFVGSQTFQGRFRKIMDSAQNALNQDTTKLTEKLDESEKKLFVAGQLGLHDFERWETRQTEKLQTSSMVLKHRKRKRALVDDA